MARAEPVNTTRALAMIGSVLLLQAWLLYTGFHYGALSGLIPGDDSVTLQRGLHNLRFLSRDQSLWRLVGFLGTIHSPISDIQTLVGLALTGGAFWGPYALNGAAVLFAAYAVLFRAGRPAACLFAALLLFILVQPVTLDALLYLKADWKGGLLIAAAVYLLYAAVEQDRRDLKLWGAGLLGLGIAAKLTAFYMPVLAIGLLMGFEGLALVARPPAPGTWGSRLQAARQDLGPAAALVTGPYVFFFAFSALGYHHLLAYIRYAISETWTDGLTPVQRALFYSPFAPGGGAWSYLHGFALLFVPAALIVSLRAGRRLYAAALLLLALFALLLFAPLVLARTSNWDFAASLLGVFAGLTLISIRVFADALPRYGARAALAVVVPLALFAPLEGPFLMPDVGRATPAELQRLEAVYRGVADDLVVRAGGGTLKLRQFYEDSFAPSPDLSLLYFQRTGELMDIERIDSIGDPAALEPDLSTSDFLLTVVPGAGLRRMHGFPARFPTSADPARADALAAARADFQLVRRFARPEGELRLYRRRS